MVGLTGLAEGVDGDDDDDDEDDVVVVRCLPTLALIL